MTEQANSAKVNFDHGIKCSFAVIHGNEAGTKRPPSGAYPANNASSNVYSLPPPRVDLYFMGRLQWKSREKGAGHRTQRGDQGPAKSKILQFQILYYLSLWLLDMTAPLIEGMGADQSKQQLSSLSSSDSSIKNAEESGGCPIKNADGTYRTMPGFASLFGAKVPEKSVDPSTSSRPATTSEIDQRSIPAWFVSFSAG